MKSAQTGASVLAALVLVAILGGVLLVFQYVRSSGEFSYEPGALVASLGNQSTAVSAGSMPAAAPAAPAPSSKETQTCDYKTQSCSCSSDKKDTTTGGITSVAQQCLPGCTYTIAATGDGSGGGTGLKAKVTTTGMSSCDAIPGPNGVCSAASLSKPCIKKYQNPDGSTQSISAAGGGNLAAEAIASAPNAAVASGLGTMYAGAMSGTDGGLQELQSQLGGYQSANETPGSIQQSTNVDAALQAMGANPNSLPGPESGTGVNIPPPTTVNPGTATDIQDPEIVAQQKQQQAIADEAGKNCKTSACVDAATGNYGGGSTFPTTPAPDTKAPAPVVAPAANSGSFNLGSIASIGLSALGGFLKGYSGASAAQQAQQAMQAAQAAQQQASAPYGTGTDGYACPPPQPQPSYSQCTVGTWQQSYQSNRCPSTWQCVPSNTNTNPTALQPSANISCQPLNADVGMSVSISYSCTNATGSTAGGFSTNNQLSGSATAVIGTPPAGANTATYGLTCVNQSQTQSLTASAQCAVQISQPSIVLVANPNVVATSSTAAIGWVTSGMNACTISSPDSAAFTTANAGNTSVNGVAITQPLTAPLHVVLTCTTIGGSTKTAQTTVTIGGTGVPANNAPLTITSSMDNASVAHGGVITLNWSSISPPVGSAVSLWLVNKQTNATNAVIAGGLGVNGVYNWHIPAIGATCNPNASNVCASDLTQGGTYAIEAVMYTPSNAYIGDGTAPSTPVAPVYGQSAVSGTFTLNDNPQH